MLHLHLFYPVIILLIVLLLVLLYLYQPFEWIIKPIILRANLNETFFYCVFLVFFTYVAYRLPTKFMLSELDLLIYFPFFNAAYTICCVLSIAQINKKELTWARLAFIVFFALSVPFMFWYSSEYYHKLYLGIDISLILAFVITSLKPHMIFLMEETASGPASGPGSVSAGGSAGGSGSGSGTGTDPVQRNKYGPLDLKDSAGNRLQAPQYTGTGQADRTFGEAMALSLEARHEFQLSQKGLKAIGVSKSWFHLDDRLWLENHLRAEHNKMERNGQFTVTRHKTMWEQYQANGLNNTYTLRNSLRSIR